MTFDGEGSWSFGNEFFRDVVIFDVDNNSPFHNYNWRNNFLVLGKRSTEGIDNGTVAAEKS